MFDLKVLRLLALFAFVAYFFGCSEDKPEPKQTTLPPTVDAKKDVVKKPSKPTPVVYIEELDQFQEYFKEQHETSLSHVSKKNWTSYTAGKDGILTKVLLFGKPNYTISEHYGSSMSGFVRADNPNTGPKLGEWSITRDEIINQLALQGLTETDRGWITLQMRGEIPQQAGRMYFIVCDQIGNKRAWFGAFAFAEGNSYKKGRFWLHPDHDLVFRTYVGKTADQLEKEQRGEPLFDSNTASLIPSNDIPKAPKPMIELSKNFEPKILTPETSPTSENLSPEQSEPLYQKATQDPVEEPIIEPQKDIVVPEETVEESKVNEIDPEEPAPKGSLFERFFKNKAE
tara:strand:+ start:4422 stop:5447 length:1026 start_codon:yes stop_codon:yes gene_type:complete